MSNSAMNVEEAMKRQNDVAMILSWHLFSTVAKQKNSVFSPASINAVFTLVASGPGSSWLSGEILSFLKSSSIDELNSVYRVISSVVFADGSNIGGPKIKVANGVWIDQSEPVDQSSKNLVETFFKAVFAQVDFKTKAEEVRKEINSWGSHHTNGLIKDILPLGSVTNETLWIYGNALYFKGAWKEKFHKSITKNKDFHLLDGTSASVPFMSSYDDQVIEAYNGFKVLKLPFHQGDDINRSFSMYFYLPDEKFGLDNLVEKMVSIPSFLDNHTPKYSVEVGEFRIPKFKITFGFSASKAFERLGLKTLNLRQKSFIEIDEDGAEAAAVTIVDEDGCCLNFEEKIDFVADHPFIFLIKEDKTGTILFVGQMFDPSKSS